MRVTKEKARGAIEDLKKVRKSMFEGRKKKYSYTDWEREREKIKDDEYLVWRVSFRLQKKGIS